MNHNAHERALDALAVVSATPDVVVVESAAPAPIGTRVCVDLAPLGLLPGGEGPLHGKVIDVRRAEGGFRIALRLHSVSKAQRAALKAGVTSA
jgi:hypothetical protein